MVSKLTVASHRAVDSALVAKLRRLPAYLTAKIQGQDHALLRIASVLTRGELGLSNPRRPRGSFLFVGPTGVGKTETTVVFTEYLFGLKPIRFDMSEYQLQKSVDRLLGERADDPGFLGRALRGVARGTLLFDEVEKAHPLVLDLFLQILEDARITLATGDTLDLSGFYIVCTSNIGSSETMRMESAPFASVERTVIMRVREHLRPELVGRVNEIVVFTRLDYATLRAICETMIAKECARLSALGYPIDLCADVLESIVREGYDRMLGARPMRAAVERFLQQSVSASLLAEELTWER